jgi:hypothetical protein
MSGSYFVFNSVSSVFVSLDESFTARYYAISVRRVRTVAN